MEAASAGDWVCGEGSCGNVNFARRTACNRCGRRRGGTGGAGTIPGALVAAVGTAGGGSGAGAAGCGGGGGGPGGPEIGKSAADKSRGLFSAEDWQCGKCANVNWARRSTCNVCNAPKFAEVEARTGYGGGYNERGVVEYRPRRDSDDEYDEFGRVKKRTTSVTSRGRSDSASRSKVCGTRRCLGSLSDASVTPPSPWLSRRPAPEAAEAYATALSPGKLRKRSSTLSIERSEYKRNLIMENRVSSTNKIKYRFKGKTAEDDFDVYYTQEERIKVAAWAIVFNNCRHSAYVFERCYDKPAPDFKTIFSWRQRLLLTGCLVDGHIYPETSSRETGDSLYKRRKRRRYFRSKDFSESSDDYSERRKNISTEKLVPDRFNRCEIKTDEGSDSGNKQLLNENNNTNGSNCRSSTSGVKNTDYVTDNARSETPEITMTRVELAQLKSPIRVVSPEMQFHEDNYFEDDLKSIKTKSNNNNSFVIPEVPKENKQISNIPPGMLEDIISESERYSSDGGGFDSDLDNEYSSKNNITNTVQDDVQLSPVTKTTLKKDDRNAYDVNSHSITDLDVIDLPLPKFGKQINNLQTNEVDQNLGKSVSFAMRCMRESMTAQTEKENTTNIEYIPTKIDPAMAIRNHRLFKSDVMVESIHDIWPSNHSKSISPGKKSQNEQMTSINKISHFLDYTPEDDELYRDEAVVEDFTEDIIILPPKAPCIGSISEKPTEKTAKLDDINSLLTLNLSGINMEGLAQVLQNVKALKPIDVDDYESPKKNDAQSDDIPFLGDMFYPGSPENSKGNSANEDRSDVQDLEDPIESSMRRITESTMSGGFKSFALPKPIRFHRINNPSQQQTKDLKIQEDNVNVKTVKRVRKLKKKKFTEDNGHDGINQDAGDNDEEEEESGEEGDLSKYDLWGSEDEGEKNKEDVNEHNKSEKEKELPNKTEINQKRDRSKSPTTNDPKRRYSNRSPSASSRRSSSSSSSTESSSGKPVRNKYDDFILNSEHSRAGSRDSSSARSRSPVYDRGRDREKRTSRSRDKAKDRSRENRDRDRHTKSRDTRDTNKSRDKNRERDRDRQRHHYGGAHSNHGGYVRGRAR